MSDIDQKTIYTDTTLPIEYAVDYRRNVGASVSHFGVIRSHQLLAELLQCFNNFRQLVRANKDLTEFLALLKQQRPDMYQHFTDSGIIVDDKTINKERVSHMHFECLLDEKDGSYGALVINQNGVAYINPTGKALSEASVQISQKPREPSQSVPLRQFIEGISAVLIHGKNVRLSASEVNLHQGVEQLSLEDKELMTDYCLANLRVLQDDVMAKSNTLNAIGLISRNDIVSALNENCPEKYALNFKHESKDAKALQSWRSRTERYRLQREKNLASLKSNPSIIEKEKTYYKVCARLEGVHLNPTTKLHQLVFGENEDGIQNVLTCRNAELTAESNGQAEIPAYERYLLMAADLMSLLPLSSRPIEIRSIEPKIHEAECIRAFRAVFGDDNVKMFSANKDIATRFITARPI